MVVAGWVPDGVCALAVWEVTLAVGYAVGCWVWYWVGCLVLGMVGFLVGSSVGLWLWLVGFLMVYAR